VFEKRVLRIFRPKRDEGTRGWRTLHNEELHNSYSSPSIIRMEEKMNAYGILMGKPEGDQDVGGLIILK
jgi:hypothetical protein